MFLTALNSARASVVEFSGRRPSTTGFNAIRLGKSLSTQILPGVGLIALLGLVSGMQAAALPICPTTIENDPPASADACSVLLTVEPNLNVSTVATGTLTYNGSDSTFGIINNSSSVISSLFLMGGDITDFSSNGIRTYISANGVPIPAAPSPLSSNSETYYGPMTTFSQVDFSRQSLLINFIGGLAPDVATYWSLAGDPATDVGGLTGPNGTVLVSTASTAVPEPSTGSLGAVAATLIAFGWYRRRRKTSSVARQLAPLLLLGVGMHVFGSAAEAAIVKLPSSPSQDEISAAKADFANGSVVAMVDADASVFANMFNVALPKSSKSATTGPLRYYVLAAHKQGNGSIHTFVGPVVKEGQNRLGTVWSSLQRWAEREQQLKSGDTPSPSAWTELSVNTLVGDDSGYWPTAGNDFQVIVSVYRANATTTDFDYYMVTQQADSKPNWKGAAWGGINSKCGWYNRTRDFDISLSEPTAKLFDHGPTTVNGSSSAGFSVGAGLSGAVPGATATFSMSWNNSDVDTQDNADPAAGTTWWHDDFAKRGNSWVDSPPDAVKDLFTSYQAAIFSVAAGTPTFNVVLDAKSEFQLEYYDGGIEWDNDIWEVAIDIPVSAPRLSIGPLSSLRVFPGQSATFEIMADIPNSTGEQLSWNISNVPDFVSSLNTTTGSGTQTITMNINADAKAGSTGTLNIDTNPTSASPDTRSGPLQFPVTVVSPSDVPPGVLFTGGLSWAGNPQWSAEVWNPATGKSTVIGNMSSARYLHTATPIQNDQILVAGGLDQNFNLVGQTEIYSEATQTFSPGPALQVPRAWHTATFLNDGTVLLAGGQDGNGNAIASAEIYDPTTNQTTAVGNMTTARMKHSATLLPDGTVFIFGGATSVTNAGSLFTSEIYNPQTRTFSASTSFEYGYQSQAAAFLNTGNVLIVTGYNDAPGNMMLCGAAANACAQSQTPADVAGSSALVALPNTPGTLALLAGGNNSFLFDSASDTFGHEASMLEQRSNPNAVLIQNTNTSYDGSVVVAGGVTANTGSSNGTTVEANDPQTNSWRAAGALTTARTQGTMTLVGAIPLSSTVQLTSSLNPSITGNQVTFTATVSGAAATATGTIAFYDGTTALGTSRMNNGNAQFQTASLSVGSHNIVAVYSGGVGIAGGSSNAVAQVVNPVPVTPVFTNLSSQTIIYGTPNINLGGRLSAPGPIYPEAGKTVQVSFGGTSAPIPIAANGVFTFNNYGTGGFSAGTYPITYSYAGDTRLTPAENSSTTLTITPATPVFSGLSSSQTTTAGTASIHLAGKIAYQGTFVPLGSITVTIDGFKGSAPISLNENCLGCFSLDFDTHSVPGSTTPYAITYSYAAAGNFNAASDSSTTLTVTSSASTTGLTSSVNPSNFGESVTFTATVTASNGTPGGMVTFKDGSTDLGSGTLSSGKTSFTTSSLAVGGHSITAVYGGGSGFASSTSAVLTQTVNKLTTMFSGLTPSQTAGYETPSLVLKGTISAPDNGYPPTTEKVQVTIGGVTGIAGIGENGAFWVSFPTSSLAAGSYPVQYSYAGDATFAAVNDSSTTLTIGKTTPVFSNLTPSQTIQAGASPIQLSGHLTQGAAVATGSIWITINGQKTSATIQLDGTFSAPVVTSGIPSSSTPYPITYSYDGNTNFNAASNSSTTLTVTSSASATGLTSSVNPSNFGESVTFAASVSASSGTPTGTVIFKDGSTNLGSGTLSSGKTSFTTSTLAVGGHSIEAVYGGDQNFASSTSSVLTQMVKPANPSFTSLTASQSVPVKTPSVQLSGVISATGPAYPAGELVILTIGSAQGKATIGPNGVFSTAVNVATLAAGSYPIQYSYAGDTNFVATADASTTLTISAEPAQTNIIVGANPNPAVQGETVTLTATIVQNGPVPTGNVTFSEPMGPNNVLIYGNADLVNGVATVVVTSTSQTSFSAGSHTLFATYSGDAQYQAATSSPYTLTVTANTEQGKNK